MLNATNYNKLPWVSNSFEVTFQFATIPPRPSTYALSSQRNVTPLFQTFCHCAKQQGEGERILTSVEKFLLVISRGHVISPFASSLLFYFPPLLFISRIPASWQKCRKCPEIILSRVLHQTRFAFATWHKETAKLREARVAPFAGNPPRSLDIKLCPPFANNSCILRNGQHSVGEMKTTLEERIWGRRGFQRGNPFVFLLDFVAICWNLWCHTD